MTMMHHKTPSSLKACPGPSCGGCSSGNCYAKGGEVDHSKGVHDSISKWKNTKEGSEEGGGGVSVAGAALREGRGDDSLMTNPKNIHRRVLGDLKMMKKPKLYAEGGAVDSWTKREDNEKGVNRGFEPGISRAGMHVRAGQGMEEEEKQESVDAAKGEHKKTIRQMRSMKKPNLYAEGGEVEGEDSGDEELNHAMGHEFLDACERKDKKGIMSVLHAIVLSCRNKG